ncbi:hypothetical protein, partial [Stenotrophomonas sp. SrG]|uniref:hypothetical protein n=1 Tax=Stenotrophomonas sp. SrG TaxID=3414430 RepID=UPI003CF00055
EHPAHAAAEGDRRVMGRPTPCPVPPVPLLLGVPVADALAAAALATQWYQDQTTLVLVQQI